MELLRRSIALVFSLALVAAVAGCETNGTMPEERGAAGTGTAPDQGGAGGGTNGGSGGY